jgi:thiamine-monophosphate kinase
VRRHDRHADGWGSFSAGSAHGAERAGRKALAVNLSDAAAMASEPMAAFISMALPREGAAELARELFTGLEPLASEFGVTIAGGDTNCWRGPLVISVTLIASCPSGKALRRSGARPGDAILVTGELGGSILGKHLDFHPEFARRGSLGPPAACRAVI